MRRCWLNALDATVNRFTDGIPIGHFVMAITGRRAPRVCGVKAGWSPLAFSRLSLNPADSFCLRASRSMLRNCMTRSAS